MKKILGLSSIFLIVDIIVKLLVKSNLVVSQSIKIIDNFFYITYVKNTGAAWSMLSGKQSILIIFSVIVLIFFIKYLLKKEEYNKIDIVGYGLFLAGTIGNLIDRVVYGYVIDYFNFYIFSYDFPIFNIADSCIVIGIVLLFISSWREEKWFLK